MNHTKQGSIRESKKIIAIGPTTQNNTVLNGATMIFQMTIDDLKKKGIDVKVVDLGASRFNARAHRVSGKFTLTKAINYIFIIAQIYVLVLSNRKTTLFLSTAQSRVGFIRDYFIISFARFFSGKIFGQQVGSNYRNFYGAQPPYLQRMIKKNWSRMDTIIVEGDYTKEQFDFLPDYESKVVSVPNGLPEPIPFAEIKPRSISSEGVIKLLYLSNLIETKGFWDVLEAARILINEKGKNVQIVFSGKFLGSVDDHRFSNVDEAKIAFHEFIERHGLEDRVTYYEGLFGLKKAQQFNESHFFLLPSYYINEGQPVSIIEALAYGCVPIVTQYRMIPMLVNEENGFFVRPQAPEEIADAILSCLENPARYQEKSQNAINTYLEKFTSERYCGDMYRILTA